MLLRSVARAATRGSRTPAWSRTRGCVVIGHRGTPRVHPEDTLWPFGPAPAVGVDEVEIDVVFDGGVPRVSHDLPGPEDAAPLETVLDHLRGRARRVYVHYEAVNQRQPDHTDHITRLEVCVRDAGMLDVVVVMGERGDIAAWRAPAPDLHVLQRWTSPRPRDQRVARDEAARHGLHHVGVYHSAKQYNPVGRALNRLGLPRLAAPVRLGPIRRLVRVHPDEVAVFTVNDPFLIRRYAAVDFQANRTDDPALRCEVLGRGRGREVRPA